MDIPIEIVGLSVERGSILLANFRGIDHPKFFVVIGVYGKEMKLNEIKPNERNPRNITKDKLEKLTGKTATKI